MTKEQYEKYEKIEKEIKGVRRFCLWCGDKHRSKFVDVACYFKILTKGKKLSLLMENVCDSQESNTFDIPRDLQERIIEVVESYLDEKEAELESI